MSIPFRKILVLGAGPVAIGQSVEYDYAATQIIRTLKAEGATVVAVNSNPTTVMTERNFADTVYIEPLNVETVSKIIKIEKPDAVLVTAGGATGLEICLELSQNGYLEENGAVLLGAQPQVIKSVHNAQALENLLQLAGEPYLPRAVAGTKEEACAFAAEAGYPVSCKAAFSPEGGSFVRCDDAELLTSCFETAAQHSLVGQAMLEKSVEGYKEICFACLRDAEDNCVSVCSTENLETVGIHGGDSVVVLPAQTLTDAETAKLRRVTGKLARFLKIEGVCVVRFALHPQNGQYFVLEVSPQLNRTTALISKATGYPIASVCAEIAIGKKLYEIPNPITGVTTAANEPAMDYCAVKVPKWSFEQFGALTSGRLNETMQATGEAFAIGTSFELAFLKAIRSMNPKTEFLTLSKLRVMDDAELDALLCLQSNERIFAVYEAVKRGRTLQEIHAVTHIDLYYLTKLKNIADTQKQLSAAPSAALYAYAKSIGFLDSVIEKLCGALPASPLRSAYNTVDTCAAEFDVQKPYYYSSWDEDNEAAMYLEKHPAQKEKILLVGSGPTSIGLGADRDYAAVCALQTLSDFGYETVMLNNSPAANTTDFAVADKLYVEPLTQEDIESVVKTEKPDAAILVFGGGEALRKTDALRDMGVTIYGADADMHRTLKNKIEFFDMLDRLNIRHPDHRHTLIGTGAEVDVLSDGTEFLIPGICEHIEKTAVHAGDTISVYPCVTLSESVQEEITAYTQRLVQELHIKGLLNIQFLIYDNAVYVTSASAVATRNIPFMSKATALPIVELATRLMLGESLRDIGIGTGVYKRASRYFVRVPVFSFEAIENTDVRLGAEMQSTGEVMGVAKTFEEALLKGFIASGMRIKRTGGVLISVADSDKQASIALADAFQKQDFTIYATANTAKLLNANHIAANAVRKMHEGTPNTLTYILKNRLSYLVSTSDAARNGDADDVHIRRTALMRRIPVLPSVETAAALAHCLAENDGVEALPVESL